MACNSITSLEKMALGYHMHRLYTSYHWRGAHHYLGQAADHALGRKRALMGRGIPAPMPPDTGRDVGALPPVPSACDRSQPGQSRLTHFNRLGVARLSMPH
uniref:Uncharacterized protein n=1 Tax=Oryza nivara TaxID=4536 RepID=A0A0E0GXA4_ORYNI